MELEVRLFGGLREHADGDRLRLDLDERATVADLRRAVALAEPRLAALLATTTVAVDLEVARDGQPLAGAREVALLPPVAGGAGDGASPVGTPTTGDGASPVVVSGLVEPPFDVGRVVASVSGPSAGGIAVFLGSVRDHAGDVGDVVALEYTAYDAMAEKVLAELAVELARDHPALTGLALLHAVGTLPVGTHTVMIVCASAHRAEAFDACRDALERVKARVPVWKREIVADGSHRWVGLHADAPTPADDDARP